MNERIRELSDIAYKNHLARNPNSSFGRRFDYDREFAELIVQECISKVENEASTYAEPVWAFELINDIKEHFGVEQ